MVLSNLCTPEEFDDALRKGLGRAVGHVRAASAETVRKQLLHACTNYLGYDLQCEGSRALWLYEMLTLTGEAGWYCDEVLKVLDQIRAFPEDSRNLYEMIHLLAVFVRKGHTELRDVLLRKIFGFEASDDVIGDDLPVDVLGVDGVVEILRRYSRSGYTAFCLGNYLFDEAFKEFGASLKEALLMAERDDEILRTYLREMREERKKEEKKTVSRQASSIEPPKHHWASEETLFSLLDGLPLESEFLNSLPQKIGMLWEHKSDYISLRNMFMVTAKNSKCNAKSEFLERVFSRLMAENDSGRRYCLLGAFAHTAMPRFEPSILALVDSPVRVLSCEAVRALSNMSAPEIRAKSREMLEARLERENWTCGFPLLTQSCQPEDLPLIIDALASVPSKTMNTDDLHSIVWDVIPLAKIGDPSAMAPIMLWVYENSPCANCRATSVSWLVENHTAPDELLTECLDDCDESIREVALKSRK